MNRKKEREAERERWRERERTRGEKERGVGGWQRKKMDENEEVECVKEEREEIEK